MDIGEVCVCGPQCMMIQATGGPLSLCYTPHQINQDHFKPTSRYILVGGDPQHTNTDVQWNKYTHTELCAHPSSTAPQYYNHTRALLYLL